MTRFPNVDAMLEAAEKATPGPYRACLGSGQHVMTGISSDATGQLIADVCPDYFMNQKDCVPREQEWENLKFFVKSRNAVDEIRTLLAEHSEKRHAWNCRKGQDNKYRNYGESKICGCTCGAEE